MSGKIKFKISYMKNKFFDKVQINRKFGQQKEDSNSNCEKNSLFSGKSGSKSSAEKSLKHRSKSINLKN